MRPARTDYDLKQRTLKFARQIRSFLKTLPVSLANQEDGRQLIRASGSVGANYLEADNALSKKDSLMRIRICLKEARESGYWLELLDLRSKPSLIRQRNRLLGESSELAKIFATILRNRQAGH